MKKHEIQKLKELKANSTQVNSWYANYAHRGEIRGPFCRWLQVLPVEPQYEKYVANISDDAKYAAAAMNAVPELIAHIESLEDKIGIALRALNKLHDGVHVGDCELCNLYNKLKVSE